jgi:menaquinol-cytochrome c reductase iron-sulfur subunit
MSDTHDEKVDAERRSHGAPPAEGTGECESCPELSVERRRFLAAFVLGSGALASAALIVPWAGLFLTPVRRPDPDEWRVVGALNDFPVGETLKVVYQDPDPLPWAGYAGRSAAWVRRDSEDEFSAFTTYCTHVGCAVRWEEGAQLFLCPCHGGTFYADGSVAAGPPPRPLDRYPIRVRDGRVEIQAAPIPEPSS